MWREPHGDLILYLCLLIFLPRRRDPFLACEPRSDDAPPPPRLLGSMIFQVRSAAYHLMRSGAPGFKVDNVLGEPREGTFNDSFFIPDGVHPLGETGHR